MSIEIGPMSKRLVSAMTYPTNETDVDWLEEDSADFIEYGWAFVPERAAQIRAIVKLLPQRVGLRVADLCAGEGLLSEEILRQHDTSTLVALDRSPTMISAASRRLSIYEGRFEVRRFDLADRGWRAELFGMDAVVSSLSVHHLTDEEKMTLFSDLASAMAPGGRLVLADLVQPQSSAARSFWAASWDESVRNQSLERFGDLRAFEAFERLKWNFFADPSPDPIDKPAPLFAQLCWLKQVGFTNVDVHWMHSGHAVFSGDRRA